MHHLIERATEIWLYHENRPLSPILDLADRGREHGACDLVISTSMIDSEAFLADELALMLDETAWRIACLHWRRAAGRLHLRVISLGREQADQDPAGEDDWLLVDGRAVAPVQEVCWDREAGYPGPHIALELATRYTASLGCEHTPAISPLGAACEHPASCQVAAPICRRHDRTEPEVLRLRTRERLRFLPGAAIPRGAAQQILGRVVGRTDLSGGPLPPVESRTANR